MSLLFDSIEEETFMKNNIGFRIIGDINKLPENVRERLNACVEHTSKNTGMCLVIWAPQLFFQMANNRKLPGNIADIGTKRRIGTLKKLLQTSRYRADLTTNFMPDPDLLIRTGRIGCA